MVHKEAIDTPWTEDPTICPAPKDKEYEPERPGFWPIMQEQKDKQTIINSEPDDLLIPIPGDRWLMDRVFVTIIDVHSEKVIYQNPRGESAWCDTARFTGLGVFFDTQGYFLTVEDKHKIFGKGYMLGILTVTLLVAVGLFIQYTEGT